MKLPKCSLLVAALGTATAFSQDVIRDDFLVNSDRPGGASQVRSGITTTDGEVIVTWGDYRYADGAALLRVFNGDLTPVSPPTRFLDASFAESYGLPMIAASPTGKLLVTYLKIPTAYTQLLDDRGNRIGPVVEMLTTPANRCYTAPLPAGLPDGSFAVAWTEERGPWQFEYLSAGLFIQKIGPNGQAESEPIALLPDSLSASELRLLVSPAGDILLSWREATGGYMGGEYRGVQIQRFDSNLQPLGSKIKLTGDLASPYAISASTRGNVLLVWRTIEHGVDNCFAQLFDAKGIPLTQRLPVDDPVPDGLYPIDAHFNTDESMTLIWYRESKLHARKMDQSGAWISADRVLPIHDHNAIAAFSKSDELILAWCAGPEHDLDTHLQKYTSEGDSLTPRTNVLDPGMDTGSGDERWPRVTGNDNGEYFIHWRDYRRGNDEYRGQRFDANHQPVGANVRPAAPDLVSEFRLLNDGSYLGYGYTRYEYATPVVMHHYKADWGLLENWQMLAAIPEIFSISIPAGGESVVVWKDKNYGAAGPVLLQRFSPAGAALFSSPITVVDSPASDHIIRLHVLPDDAGNAVVLWGSWLNDHAVGTYSRFVTSSGAVSAQIAEIARGVVLNSGEGNVAQVRGGNALMVWFDMNQKRLFGKLFDQMGTPLAEAFAIQNDGSPQADPFGFSVTASARGFVVVWQDHSKDLRGAQYSSIYAQVYSPDGEPLGDNFRVVQNDDYPAGSPTLLAQGEEVVFIWEDGRRVKGYDIFAKVVSFNWRGTGVHSNGLIVPAGFRLSQSYPNPLRLNRPGSNTGTVIRYDLPQPAFVNLEIYNLIGQKVRTLVSEQRTIGSYRVFWNGLDDEANAVPSGIYFYRIDAGHFKQMRKLALIR